MVGLGRRMETMNDDPMRTSKELSRLEGTSPEIRILVVDDEESIRQVLKRGLEKEGYRCETAEDGKVALQKLENSEFDIVISDIKMPEMDGIELTRAIRERYTTDIIIITGYYEDFRYEEMIEIGASDFLEKPVRLGELDVRIKRVLRERQALLRQQEMTALVRENERMFRKTFEAIPVPAFLWEKQDDGQIVLGLYNRAGYEATEGRIADSLGIGVEEYHGHQPEIASQIKYTMESGESYHEQRSYRSRSSGMEYWLDINYTQPFKDSILVVSPDITEQKQAEEELRRLSYLDGLTGIANRRYFDEIMHREWLRAARNEKPISLVMVDVDHFKPYNDTYGHPEGDRCLKKIVAALQRSIKRPADMIARYGGEEFASILPDTDEKGARIVADAQRSEVERLEIEHKRSGASDWVTISLGVATVIPKQGSSPAEIIAAADQALYIAKSEGRNRVTVSEKV